jgi:Spy/CpxP family protein refolding chaperone
MIRTLLATFGILASALAASAFPGGPPPFAHEAGPSPDALIARHAAELGISDATLAQIRALAEQHRAEARVMIEELHTQKLALREKLDADSPDERDVIALARTIGTLETDLSVARLTSLLRVHALLTPEQNEALREKMRGRFHERRELLDRVVAACDAEIAEHCDDAGGPPGHGVMCLMHKHRAERLSLSSACEQALKELPPPHFVQATAGLVEGAPPPPESDGTFNVLLPAPPEAQELE